jgi:hypothetical protein
MHYNLTTVCPGCGINHNAKDIKLEMEVTTQRTRFFGGENYYLMELIYVCPKCQNSVTISPHKIYRY